MTKIYGIKNCDTMKKAFLWFETQDISYDFHDYKKLGAVEDVLKDAIAQHGWETVINRRGTTWRKLTDEVKAAMNDEVSVSVALEHPSMIKRPLIVVDADIVLGFDVDVYAAKFGGAA